MEEKTCNTCKYYEPADEHCAFHNAYFRSNEVCDSWLPYKRKTDAERNPFHQIPGQMSIEDFGN